MKFRAVEKYKGVVLSAASIDWVYELFPRTRFKVMNARKVIEMSTLDWPLIAIRFLFVLEIGMTL